MALFLEVINLPIMAALVQLAVYACIHQIICLSLPTCCSKYDRCSLSAIKHSAVFAAVNRAMSIVMTIVWVATRKHETQYSLASTCWWDVHSDEWGTADDPWECYRKAQYCGASCADRASNGTVWWSRKGFISANGAEEDSVRRGNNKKSFVAFASESECDTFYERRWDERFELVVGLSVFAIALNFSMIFLNLHTAKMATEGLDGQRAAPVGVIYPTGLAVRGPPTPVVATAQAVPMAQVIEMQSLNPQDPESPPPFSGTVAQATIVSGPGTETG